MGVGVPVRALVAALAAGAGLMNGCTDRGCCEREGGWVGGWMNQ